MALQEEITAFVNHYTEAGHLSNDRGDNGLPEELQDVPFYGTDEEVVEWVESNLDAPDGFVDGLIRISRAARSQSLAAVLRAQAQRMCEKGPASLVGIPCAFSTPLSESLDLFYHEPEVVGDLHEALSRVVAPLMAALGVSSVEIDPTVEIVTREGVDPDEWAVRCINYSAMLK